MAVLDGARRRVLLTSVELEAAVFLVSGHDEPTPEPLRGGVDGLVDGGLLRDGRMADVLAELVTILARPALEVVVETQAAGERVVTMVYGTPLLAVLVAPAGPDRWVLSPLEPGNLPFALSAIVGFGSRPAPAVRRPLEVTGPTLAADDEKELAALLRGRRLSWRVSVTWNAGDGSVRRGALAIVDGGDAGMWETAPLDPDRPEAGVRLSPLPSSEVWQRLLALAPPPRSPARVG